MVFVYQFEWFVNEKQALIEVNNKRDSKSPLRDHIYEIISILNFK